MTDFNFLTTHVGSVPYPTVEGLTEKLASLLDVPAWPQLPRRSFRESMYVQYSPTLPAICEDAAHEKIFFDTRQDYTDTLEGFYTPVLADDVDSFALKPEYAAVFYAMLETLRSTKGDWAKGQATGPVSFGLTVTDQDLKDRDPLCFVCGPEPFVVRMIEMLRAAGVPARRIRRERY